MATLLERFKEFLNNQCLLQHDSKILVAVSGGVDSMALLHLFYRAKLRCEVAHCNYNLRGTDSESDEELVEKVAKEYDFIFYKRKFITTTTAAEEGISIQMAARKLRYQWFNELAEIYKFDVVAVAHHANDVAETMLLNLAKGTGLAGMHGIKAVNGKIIRPLLFAEKKELETYVAEQQLEWRNDSSNQEVYYQRNKIRQEVVPVLQKINPHFIEAMQQHARIVMGYEALLSEYISELKIVMIRRPRPGVTTILLLPLYKSSAPGIVLYHFLQPFNVSNSLCTEILNCNTVGANFFSNGFKIVRDRDELNIFDPDFFSDDVYQLNEADRLVLLPNGKLSVNAIAVEINTPVNSLPDFTDENTAYIDAILITYPLTIRKWRKGDAFQPLGMKGRKLLSDFFIDSKFSSENRESVHLLLSGEEIVWVIGIRIDDRFKINPDTKKAIRITYKSD